MQRRDFLRAGLACAAAGAAFPLIADTEKLLRVMTVAGPLPADQLGTTLPHEHVMVDFIGAEQVTPDRYDRDEVAQVVLPHLRRLRQAGGQTLIECTPAYLGRDPRLLQRLAHASQLHILTNTGYYGARQGKFLPEHAKRESAHQLAERWLAEWRDGIDETGVRPGFIKIGVDAGPLSAVNRKLVQAAARTHLQSGLTIAAHTGDGRAALEQLAVLGDEGVAPQAWIWVHAQNESDRDLHLRAADQGAWVEFDGIKPETIDDHVSLVDSLRQRGHLGQCLVSQDAGWYSVGEPGGGDFRSYDTLLTRFLPALSKAGFSDQEIEELTVNNPAQAFTLRPRPA